MRGGRAALIWQFLRDDNFRALALLYHSKDTTIKLIYYTITIT